MTQAYTREELIRRVAAGGAFLTIPGLLAACGGGSGIKGAAATTAATTAASKTLKGTLTISNWPLYIDIDEKTKKRPTIQQFQKKYGVSVRYIEDVNDNDQFFGKVQAQLRRGQGIDRDIMVLTDWMAARMVRLGWVQKLDKSAIPNFSKLEPALAHPGWDPERDHSLPWQSGLTGIAYNEQLVGHPVTSVDQLLTDPKLHGKVTLLTEMPDTMGIVMLSNGDDPSKVTKAAFDKAIAKIKKAVDSGQVRQFTGNDYGGMMAKGDVWAAFAWSGDIVQLQADNDHLKFNLPDTGGMIWTDNMLIPTGGDVYTASTFMNFVYEPKIAAQIEDYVNYICPVVGAKEELLKIDPGVAKNPLIFPPKSELASVHIFDAKAADQDDYKAKFQKLLGA
ncbi:MAG TPA: spermidine/putrescine ABC transporter substrate-binding protein [Gaiellaceae bacterium]|jgi:spermidine/putrescine transport system substrate-binding protein|nr:spermidine/putrescine ABC transporter substrate-binding protein [Gaiellaceae bacterium]